MESLTVSSSLIGLTADKKLSPAKLAILWVIGDELDKKRIPEKVDNAVWLEIPSQKLRGQKAKDDNTWLRVHLKELMGLQIEGEYRDDPWGAVILAEWKITNGGRLVRLLIPPAAVEAIRAPKTFAKIESHAAYSMTGTARRLYAALADKKRLGNPYWSFTLDELRRVLDLEEKYLKWADLRRYALLPAIEEINDFGTVKIRMTLQREARAVKALRFDWQWKSLDEVWVTDEENQRLKGERHKDKTQDDAPPLTDLPEYQEMRRRKRGEPVTVDAAPVKTGEDIEKRLKRERAERMAAFDEWSKDQPRTKLVADFMVWENEDFERWRHLPENRGKGMEAYKDASPCWQRARDRLKG